VSIDVVLTDDAKADLRALADAKLQKVALQWMQRLRRTPTLGAHLEWRPGGDLRECRKIYFDEDDTPLELTFMPAKRVAERPRFRIVYRLLPDKENATHAQILGVGPKRDSEGGIYTRVARRLRDDDLEDPTSDCRRTRDSALTSTRSRPSPARTRAARHALPVAHSRSER
jgi:hypothetical protein